MSLPGSFHAFEKGECCDRHPKITAIAKMQGETDSFGCEYIFMCQECVDNHKAYLNSDQRIEDETKHCDWCKEIRRCFPTRDYDEGMNGPVYYLCQSCLNKQDEAIREELDRYDAEFYYDYYDDYDDREDEYYETP